MHKRIHVTLITLTSYPVPEHISSAHTIRWTSGRLLSFFFAVLKILISPHFLVGRDTILTTPLWCWRKRRGENREQDWLREWEEHSQMLSHVCLWKRTKRRRKQQNYHQQTTCWCLLHLWAREGMRFALLLRLVVLMQRDVSSFSFCLSFSFPFFYSNLSFVLHLPQNSWAHKWQGEEEEEVRTYGEQD